MKRFFATLLAALMLVGAVLPVAAEETTVVETEADMTVETEVEPEVVTHTVTFIVGKSVYLTAEVEDGDTVADPGKPRVRGYLFKAFFTKPDGGKKFKFDTPITEDTVLYGRFIPISLLFGAMFRDDVVEPEVPEEPECEHAAFGDWVSNENGTHTRTCENCTATETDDCTMAVPKPTPTRTDAGKFVYPCTVCAGDIVRDTLEVASAAELKAALELVEDGDTITLAAGAYDLAGEILNIDKALHIVGSSAWGSELKNVVFNVDSSSADHKMEAVFENLKFTGTSRVIVGQRSHHNGVGGPDVLPVTALTIRDCYAKTTFTSDNVAGGKGQFVYLAATYTVKLDLTLEGNTMINAHTIENEDAAPVVCGNGTVINKINITNNTFGDAENPCDRYAVKFARRANGTVIDIKNNTVYGATTETKDFYLLDLWQSGSNVQNGLTVTVTGNTINCTPLAGRIVYNAFLEASVEGSNFVITSDGGILNNAVETPAA